MRRTPRRRTRRWASTVTSGSTGNPVREPDPPVGRTSSSTQRPTAAAPVPDRLEAFVRGSATSSAAAAGAMSTSAAAAGVLEPHGRARRRRPAPPRTRRRPPRAEIRPRWRDRPVLMPRRPPGWRAKATPDSMPRLDWIVIRCAPAPVATSAAPPPPARSPPSVESSGPAPPLDPPRVALIGRHPFRDSNSRRQPVARRRPNG